MPESNGINLNRGTGTLPTFSFVGDTNTGINSSAADSVQMVAGGLVGVNVTDTSVILAPAGVASATFTATNFPINVSRVALAAADTAGGVFAWANPYGGNIIVTAVVVNVTTQSSGACTLDVGVAADGTTLNDTIIDGVSVATTGAKDSQKDAGTNGAGAAQVTSTQYVTGSVASGASSGLVGYAYIYWHRV